MEVIVKPCSLGQVLIATDFDRLAAVEIGATVEDCYRTLINRWSHTTFSGTFVVNDKQPRPFIIDAVIEAVDTGTLQRGIEFYLRGTLFQQKVWDALKKISSGTTETYKSVANEIGHPSAVRAVANAVGANPLAVIIPCHRIVRADGKLGGYRWGEKLKRQLLEREGL